MKVARKKSSRRRAAPVPVPLAVRAARMLRRLGKVEGLDESELYLLARSLAATPDERWQMHETFLRSHGLFTRSARKAFGFR